MGEAEIVTRRRKWTPEQKATLLAEVDAEGGRVSAVAKRHGLAESLLYNWRAAERVIAANRPMEALEFVPIGVFGHTAADGSPVGAANRDLQRGGPERRDRAGIIEIDLAGGTRVSVDAFVNERALCRVLRVLRNLT
jgi:transposase